MWGSPKHDNEYIGTWHEWCMCNHFNTGLSNYYIEYKIKEDSNLYIIDSQNDLIKLIESYDRVENELPITVFVYPNFEAIAKDYDGIYLTQKGQYDTHMPIDKYEYNLYGWDCECLLIFNPDIIVDIKEKRLKNFNP